MRACTAFLLFILLPSLLSGQKSASKTPPPQRQVPGRDPVVVIESIGAGGSKHYSWNGNAIDLSVAGAGDKCRKISIAYNGRKMLTSYCLLKEPKHLSLALSKKVNMLVLSAADHNEPDSFSANLVLSDNTITYNVTVQLRNGKRDTIYFKRSR